MEINLYRKGGKIYFSITKHRSPEGISPEAPTPSPQDISSFQSKGAPAYQEARATGSGFPERREERVAEPKRKPGSGEAEERAARFAFESPYQVIVSDGTIESPFALTRELFETAIEWKGIEPKSERAKKVFDWIIENIEYDYEKYQRIKKGKPPGKIRSGKSTYRDRCGICSEQAYLYVAMARAAGLKSGFVEVSVDSTGGEVRHACAYVEIEGGYILADPAYKAFPAPHKAFKEISDDTALGMFQAWRRA